VLVIRLVTLIDGSDVDVTPHDEGDSLPLGLNAISVTLSVKSSSGLPRRFR
jgi:hypothetical protein